MAFPSQRGPGHPALRLSLLLSLAATVLATLPAVAAAAIQVPPGFSVDTPVTGLTRPTTLEFGPGGEVFVAERNGRILLLDGVEDETPAVFADFRLKVHGYSDRGLLGLALDPDYPDKPYVYVSYTYDAPIGGTAPANGGAGDTDTCPYDPSSGAGNCVVSGRLSRFELDPATGLAATDPLGAPAERVLIEDWCQQFKSHSVGDVEFRPGTRELYVTGGEGASYEAADVGQLGSPPNPCGDPPFEGGALRSLDVITPGSPSDPTGYNGTVLRVDPDTGAALPGNPLFGGGDERARRIIAYGLRNPFRIEFRPGTGELYIQDTGAAAWEEVNRVQDLSVARNFGWPCFEGPDRQVGFDPLDVDLCEDLYAQPPANLRSPWYRYGRSTLYPGDTCNPAPGAASTGLSFHQGTHFPSTYLGTLFMANAPRGCIWAMRAGTSGLPDTSQVSTFATASVANEFIPVDIVEGPDGALYLPNYYAGEIVRIRHFPDNSPPIARLSASTTHGAVPLPVTFDAEASTDAEGDPLYFEWDLDGDGQFDDAAGTSPTAARTYTDGSANVLVKVRVGDSYSHDVEQVRLFPGNRPPDPPVIEQPTASLSWAVGEAIAYSGRATDPDQGPLPGSSLLWSVTTEHCPQECHTHPLFDQSGASGTFAGPDHEYPSHLTVRLTATDARGMSVTSAPLRLDPREIQVTLESDPAGISLAHNGATAPAPFTVPMIAGASANLSAPSSASVGGLTHNFASWSDGGVRVHTIAPTASTTYTATYTGPDVTEPETTILSGPLGPTSSSTPSFAFASTEGGSTFECSLDTGTPAWTSCSSPLTSPALPHGASRTFRVRARDQAGNLDSSPATRAFTVDTQRPDTTISEGPTGPTNSSSPAFEFYSPEGGVVYECSLDQGVADWHGCTSPYATTPLPHGAALTFRARAVDAAGNRDATPATRSFTVDTVAPETTITSGAKGVLGDPAPMFTFVSSEGGEDFECSVDTGIPAFAPCSGPGKTHTPDPLDDGAYLFRVRAIDGAGNADPSPASEAFSIFTAPPFPQPPATVLLRIASRPSGVPLRLGPEQLAAPFALKLEKDSTRRLAAPWRVKLRGRLLYFRRWSNRGPRIQLVRAEKPVRYLASYGTRSAGAPLPGR